MHAKLEMASPPEVPLVFDSVSDRPENGNLNGDSIWRPSDGGLPHVGSLVIWPDAGKCRWWPKWARPRHDGSTMILFADGHVKAVDSTDYLQFRPKEE